MLSTAASALARASLFDWLLLLVALLLGFYLWGTWTYDFFDRRGLPCLRPAVPFLGNLGHAFVGLKAFPDAVKELYDRGAGEPVFGTFEFRKPQYMIRDPEVLKIIAVKDFDCFSDHRALFEEVIDPTFTRNLFSLRGQKWRDMRATLSPAFTTSKLKGMFGLILECGRQLADHLTEKCNAAGNHDPLELNVKEVFSRFTNDVIASTTFGVCCDSLKNPSDEFYLMGQRLNTFSMWVFAGYIAAPRLMRKLGVRMANTEATAYFDTLVHRTIRARKEKGIFRPDMLQLLMQARDGELRAEDGDQEDSMPTTKGRKIELEDIDITSQALIFFFGGFETLSVAMCYAVYALAVHPDVQQRLHAEVDHLMDKTGGELSYDDVVGLKYLDMVISESLRLYPPASATDRQCASACTVPLPGGRPALRFQEGDLVWVPTHGVHRDPEHWPDPERFDPERFSDENKHSVKPFTYMPFGLGPRACIAQRLALLELKVALVQVVARFDLLPTAGTPVPIAYSTSGSLSFTPQGGFVYAFRPRPRQRQRPLPTPHENVGAK